MNKKNLVKLYRKLMFPILNLFKYKKTYWYSYKQSKITNNVLRTDSYFYTEIRRKKGEHFSNWEDAILVKTEYTNLDKFFWIQFGTIHSK